MQIEHSAFLEFAFEITFFGLFLILAFYIFKSKILPNLYVQIREKINQKNNLIEKCDLVVEAQKTTSLNIAKESEHLELVENKVKKWKSKKLEEIAEKKAQIQAIKKEIENKRKIQTQNFENIKLNQKIIPKAIKLATEEIKSKKNTREEAFTALIKKIDKLNLKTS